MKRSLFLVVLSLLWLAGCGSRTIQTYTLSPADPPGERGSPYAHRDVRVDYPKGIDDTLSTRIYYTRGDLTRSHYLYSRWSQPLNRLVMGHLIETLQRAHTFRHVLDYASEAGSDYILETTIYRFDHRVTPEGSFAELSIGLRLLRTGDKSLVRSRRFDYRIPCERTDARGFVAAADRGMSRFAADTIRWLEARP